MPFNLFHKKKPKDEPHFTDPKEKTHQTALIHPQETPETNNNQTTNTQENPPNNPPTTQKTDLDTQETKPNQTTQEETQTKQPNTDTPNTEPPTKQQHEIPTETLNKTYLKAIPLKDISDTEKIKTEVSNGNIVILRVTPLAGKSIEDVKNVVNDLFQFAETTGGDIARLGEERVVICPKNIRIWREKTPMPVAGNTEPLPTAA
ncbi:MAG: cell division protein SepF [Nitrososphaerota archaeon]|jgi:SepF-like predicted cell division protein (DUF552 family)|nr:cell division protein SepF [Nitrososphaerota archaeon]